MKDSHGHLVLGRTKWRRFAAVVVPATIAMTALMGGIASGATPVALNVSGSTAMLSADQLQAWNFKQFPGTVKKPDGTVIPVAATTAERAEITNLCQSVKVGPITLFIRGGREPGKPVKAEDLVMGMDYMSGDAVFEKIHIGTDAHHLNSQLGEVGGFGQNADKATVNGVNQRFYSTYAGKFYLTGMSLNLKFDGSECFTTIKN
ncbi:DUF6230 family protein [Catelliglobosispora koreensis]|uniref:DUF6230 family protein n=1 Tax=Catelliglobosispora koreensis TaxID=129052 RepID=UPI00036BEF0E|nr:DUF6230 family protein [Catelliglobosispora koreensis]